MLELSVVRSQVEDADALSLFAKRVFYETFKESTQADNLSNYLETFLSKSCFEEQLTSPKYWTYHFCNPSKVIEGYLQFHWNEIEFYNGIHLELKRFYVDPEFHGKGVAAMMMQFALEEMYRLGFRKTWLGVWEHNYRAQKFYKKWNFREIGEHPFLTGTESQRDLIFALEL